VSARFKEGKEGGRGRGEAQYQKVEQCVDAIELVVGDGTNGLLTHSALIRVARRLIVVRVRDETGHHSQNGHWVDFQMRVFESDVVIAQRNKRCTTQFKSDDDKRQSGVR
jgi:hypothetical protein